MSRHPLPAPATAFATALATVLATVLATALTSVLTVAGVPSPAYAASTCAPDPVLCPSRPYFGAAVDESPRAHQAMASFADAVGRVPSIDSWFQSWADTFDVLGAKEVVAAGMLPMVTWEPFDAAKPSADTFPLKAIAAGTHDGYIATQAKRIASVGARVVVRFGHEMNGQWYPWGQPRPGYPVGSPGVWSNTPADYVAAWRRIHDVFEANGAANVVWLWAPNLIDAHPELPLASLYPGDAYVDWLGVSGYFASTWATFANRFPATFAQFDRFAPTKPILIAETAVLPGSQRADQVRDLVRGAVSTPRVIGLVWFDLNKREPWRIDDDAPAAAALGAELAAGGFSSGARRLQPVLEAPRAVSWTMLEGGSRVGTTVRGTQPRWVTTDDGGPITSTGSSWWRCLDAITTTSCSATGVTGPVLTLGDADAGHVIRFQATARNAAGTTTAWSEPSPRVLAVPARPAAPTVTSRASSAVVRFPSAPAGATHWRVAVDGVPRPLVPTTTPAVTLTGLVSGPSYTLTLQAAAVDGDRKAFSDETAGTFAAIPRPRKPAVAVSGTTATFTLPTAPSGSRAWQLVVDGRVRDVAHDAYRVRARGLAVGQPHSWSLRAMAGTFAGDRFGSTTPAVSGRFTPLRTPAPPRVTPGRASVTFTFPRMPAGGRTWHVRLGRTTYEPVRASRRSFTVVRLKPGARLTYRVTAVRGSLSSAPVTGVVRPR